jgi:hypothetical protein
MPKGRGFTPLFEVKWGTFVRFLVVVRPNFRRDELATGDYTITLVPTFGTGRRMRHGFDIPLDHSLICGMSSLARVSHENVLLSTF